MANGPDSSEKPAIRTDTDTERKVLNIRVAGRRHFRVNQNVDWRRKIPSPIGCQLLDDEEKFPH